MKSGIIQPLIDFAKAGQEKADKDAETKNINGLFYLGKASAFSDIILKAELLFKVQQNKDSQPALQKTDCSKLFENLEQKLSREYAVRDFAIRGDAMVVQHRTNARIELLQKLIEEFSPIA